MLLKPCELTVGTDPMKTRTYSELIFLPTFEERFEYLKLRGKIGEDTFGFDRWINQNFYRSKEWKRIRDQVILRDNGCDLACPDREIYGKAIIHHMNPVNIQDIVDATEYLLNPEFLICTTLETHNAIHYGDSSGLLRTKPTVRLPNDTCPWRK